MKITNEQANRWSARPTGPDVGTRACSPRNTTRRGHRHGGLTPERTPRRGAAVYEYTFRRRRIAEPLGTVRSPADAVTLLRDYMRPDEAEQERLVVALLNVKAAVIGVETLYIGNASGASVRVGEVFRAAVRLNAASVLLAHNHPSGDPMPSADDLSITQAIAAAGRILDIALLDHVVLGSDGRTASLRALGHLG